ncbi:target of Myb protein 1 isoform X2 [Electrophorus electricus]|uniref:target of Myb protein 1 isoform X2 n=1 Tax=Electrophorus electricus TaxID=8005 RepID=UPI0015CFEBE5|nr:target of Myb protein 1 isoform X2 [Electrophorus electricus]
MEFLTGNPFSTPVGQRIEHATSPTLQSEDWGLNMEICDIINETEDGAKDAVRAIKKRIVGNKNCREVMLALSVLEACVKNCGHRFHVLVSSREFVEGVLVRTILPKNDPPLVLHDRVLTIIQAWADAFRSSPDLTGVVFVYEDLRRKGLDFPVTELYSCSPIHTPVKRVLDGGSSITAYEASLSPSHQAQAFQNTPPTQNAEDPLTFSLEQVKKLRADLEVARSDLKVMTDIMTQMDPGCIQKADTEFLQQLYSKCRATQSQVVRLIPKVTDEKLMEELLVSNDDMNAVFAQYHSFEILHKQSNGQLSPTNGSLIDLSPGTNLHNQSKQTTSLHRPISPMVTSLSNQMATLSTNAEDCSQKQRYSLRGHHKGDSLENAALVGLTAAPTNLQCAGGDDNPDSTLLGSSPQFYWMVEKGMIPVSHSGVMDDIKQWLNEDDDDDLSDSEGVTSEEFDRFLAERAKAGERLPSVRTSSHDHRPSHP